MLRHFRQHYLNRYHGRYQHARQLFIFDLALLGFTLVLLGGTIFFAFWKAPLTDLVDLNLSLGSERLTSGQLVRLTVTYTNQSELSLENAKLAVQLPSGFVIDRERTPETVFSAHSTFSLDTIPPAGQGQVELWGRWWTIPRTPERWLASMSFQTPKKNKQYLKATPFTATALGSVLQTTISIPSTTLPKLNLPVALSFSTPDPNIIGPVTVQLNLLSAEANNFKPLTITSTLIIRPGHETKITENLSAPERPGIYQIIITPLVSANNYAFPQPSAQATFEVIAPIVSSSVSLALPQPYAVAGQTLPLVAAWHNESATAILRPTLRLFTNPELVDFSATAQASGLRPGGNALIADRATRTSLSLASPGSRDRWEIPLQLRPSFNLDPTEALVSLTVTPVFSGEVAGVPGRAWSVTGTSLTIPLATELSAAAAARYYTNEGDQLGRGPLPPRVGKTTRYWVITTLANTLNAVRDVTWQTTLPPGVNFTNKQSVTIGPRLEFQPGNRAVSWSFRELPAFSQTTLSFEVSVTPTIEQLNQLLPLTGPFIIAATDDRVGKTFGLELPPATSALPQSDRGARAGTTVVGK